MEIGMKSPQGLNISHRRWKHIESLQEVRRINERMALIRENRQFNEFETETDCL